MSPKDSYAKDLVPEWSCWKFSMDIEHVELHGWSLYWGYILGGVYEATTPSSVYSQQNSSIPPCAPAMMCDLATNLQMWCHMTMGWNLYNFRPQIPFFPYKVFISVVSVYSVRKLTNPYTDPDWKGNRSQVTVFLLFYSNFDWMFRRDINILNY